MKPGLLPAFFLAAALLAGAPGRAGSIGIVAGPAAGAPSQAGAAPLRGAAGNPGAPATALAATAPQAARVIALAPHITEMIFAAGAGDRIVATVSSSDYPAAAQRIPRIGNGIQVNVERIVALKPDLVAAWQSAGAAQTLAPMLSRLHVPLIYIQPARLQDIPRAIIRLGQRLGTETAATRQAGLLQQRIDRLSDRYARRPVVSVFIEVGSQPLYTIGRDPLLNNALQICAGANIYGKAALAAPQISPENVLVARPDAVIVPTTSPERLAERIRYWSQLRLPAALNGHIYAIDPDTLFRPGPRLVDAAGQLCKDLDQVR
jgi:iron complex transport system substrate-binding protein/vitamin B12 transport system substrate-binding protein